MGGLCEELMKFVDLGRQYEAYGPEIREAVLSVLDSGQFILGDAVMEIEDRLARYVGVDHGVGVASGTDGLVLSLRALGAGEESVVVTTPFTFAATAEAIVLAGARPVFVDIEADTFNMDCSRLRDELERMEGAGRVPGGIITVSLYGQCADMDGIGALARSRGLFLIEDACQSFGAAFRGRMSGGFGDAGVTSFFPSKPLGCYGDGGMIFTSDGSLARRLRSLRNHGQERRYIHDAIGMNSRLDAIQAAVLLVKFRYFEQELAARREAAERYGQMIGDPEGIILPEVKDDRTSVFAQYTLRISGGRRDRVRELMENAGIPIAVHYPVPLHLQPAFDYLGYANGDFPVAEAVSQEVLSLPMHAFISIEEQERVVEALLEALKACA